MALTAAVCLYRMQTHSKLAEQFGRNAACPGFPEWLEGVELKKLLGEEGIGTACSLV